MAQYFYEADALAFQYHVLNTLKEIRYRLHELTTASARSIEAFHHQVREKKNVTNAEFATPVKYGFSAALAPLQTLKDLLEKVIPGFNFEAFLEDIPGGVMLLQLRHAVVHDGQQPVALYADGRFYVAVDTRRMGQSKKKKIEILAPEEDVETITLRFYENFSRGLANALATMDEADKLHGPAYSIEWFQEAAKHPSLRRFNIPVNALELEATQTPHSPLDESQAVALEIAETSRRRLQYLSSLPAIPFP